MAAEVGCYLTEGNELNLTFSFLICEMGPTPPGELRIQ